MMVVWVFRNGTMTIKKEPERSGLTPVRTGFPTPMISRMEAYESPIDGAEITSWGQRDREMRAHDTYDPRDLPKGHVYEKSKGRKP